MKAFPAEAPIAALLFLGMVATTVAGALMAALCQRVIRSVCGLAVCCLGLGGLFYFLHSPFLALMEILVYVGAICITIVFAIMLAEPDEPAPGPAHTAAVLWGGCALVISLWLFWTLSRLGIQQAWPAPEARVNDGSVSAIGTALLTTYSMAFELISLVLMVAILGALVIARYGRTKT